MNKILGPAPTDSRNLESEIIRLRNRINRITARLADIEDRVEQLEGS